MRTSQGAGGCTPDSGEAFIFRAKAKFFGQKPATKNEKKILFIKRKTVVIPSIEIQRQKSGNFTNNYLVGESGKAILQVRITVFRGLSKYSTFPGKDDSAPSPRKKIGPYAYAPGSVV